MHRPLAAAVAHRARGLQRLNELTIAIAVVATGLLATFAVVAAATIPGKSDTNAQASTAPPDQERALGSVQQEDRRRQVQLQQPSSGWLGQGGSSRPIAVTGGSH